jgi:hypothetical protein
MSIAWWHRFSAPTACSACQVRPDLASRGSPLTPSTGRQPARQRPPCQSCGGEGDGRHTTLRGLEVSLWVRGMVNENARRAAVRDGSA